MNDLAKSICKNPLLLSKTGVAILSAIFWTSQDLATMFCGKLPTAWMTRCWCHRKMLKGQRRLLLLWNIWWHLLPLIKVPPHQRFHRQGMPPPRAQVLPHQWFPEESLWHKGDEVQGAQAVLEMLQVSLEPVVYVVITIMHDAQCWVGTH